MTILNAAVRFPSRFVFFGTRQLATQNQNTESDVFSSNTNVSSDSSDFDFDITPNIPDAEESMEKEEKFRNHVERMRDVSRFSKITAAKKYKQEFPTYSDVESFYLKSPKYFRRVYSRFGKESGIAPGIAWPSKEQLQNKIRDEQTYDLTLKEKIDLLIQRKTEEIENIEKLEKESDDALAKMPKAIEKFYLNVQKKELMEEEKLKKRQEILDQAREYYGFEVDLRDRRIKEMVDKLQEDRRKSDRIKKKEEEKKKFAMMKQLKVEQSATGANKSEPTKAV